MESIFQPKKSTTNQAAGAARQSSLLATDVFRRVEPGDPLQNAPEEMKQQETITIKGFVAENELHAHNRHHQ